MVFADRRKMLQTQDLDVVDINLRWDVELSPTRVEAGADAARRGIHVVIAKPLAETWAQCKANVKRTTGYGEKSLLPLHDFTPLEQLQGDTISAESEVLEVRPSRSRPGQGLVRVRTRGFNKRDETIMTFERTVLVYARTGRPTA